MGIWGHGWKKAITISVLVAFSWTGVSWATILDRALLDFFKNEVVDMAFAKGVIKESGVGIRQQNGDFEDGQWVRLTIGAGRHEVTAFIQTVAGNDLVYINGQLRGVIANNGVISDFTAMCAQFQRNDRSVFEKLANGPARQIAVILFGMLNDINAPKAAGRDMLLSGIVFSGKDLRIVLATADEKQAFVYNEELIAGILTGKGTITVFDETKTGATAKPYTCNFFDDKMMKEMGISTAAPKQNIPPLPTQTEALPVNSPPLTGIVPVMNVFEVSNGNTLGKNNSELPTDPASVYAKMAALEGLNTEEKVKENSKPIPLINAVEPKENATAGSETSSQIAIFEPEAFTVEEIKTLRGGTRSSNYLGASVTVVRVNLEGDAYIQFIANLGDLKDLNKLGIIIADKNGNFGVAKEQAYIDPATMIQFRTVGPMLCAYNVKDPLKPSLAYFEKQDGLFVDFSKTSIISKGEKAVKLYGDFESMLVILKKLGVTNANVFGHLLNSMRETFGIDFYVDGHPIDNLVQVGKMIFDNGDAAPNIETGQKTAKGLYLSLTEVNSRIMVCRGTEMADIQTMLTNSAYAEMAKDILSSGDLIAARVVTVIGCTLKKQGMLAGASVEVLNVLEASRQFLKIDPSALTSKNYNLEVRDGIVQLVPRQ